jgi:ABC-type bacteriocin/lantibiotic exporter with double-glycine peptidase domain
LLFLCPPAAPQEAIVAVTQALGIHDQIVALKGGYDEVLGESGAGLSGGEQQRVLLANALLRLVFQGGQKYACRLALAHYTS